MLANHDVVGFFVVVCACFAQRLGKKGTVCACFAQELGKEEVICACFSQRLGKEVVGCGGYAQRLGKTMGFSYRCPIKFKIVSKIKILFIKKIVVYNFFNHISSQRLFFRLISCN